MKYASTICLLIILNVGCNTASNKSSTQSKDTTATDHPTDKSSQKSPELNSIGKYTIQSLLDSGLTISPKSYTINFKTKRAFKKDSIILWIYSTIEAKGRGKIDSVTFYHNDKPFKIGNLKLSFSSPLTLIAIKNNQGNQIHFDDFNFDTHPDVAIFNSEESGVKNIMEEIYIFDKTKETFFYNPLLSQSSNIEIDTVNQMISTFGQGGMASQIYWRSFYKWNNTGLVPIKHINQKFDKSINKFIRTTKELHNDEWTTQIDTLSQDQVEDGQ